MGERELGEGVVGIGMNGGEREDGDEETVARGRGRWEGNVRKGIRKGMCGRERKLGNEERVLWG